MPGRLRRELTVQPINVHGRMHTAPTWTETRFLTSMRDPKPSGRTDQQGWNQDDHVPKPSDLAALDPLGHVRDGPMRWDPF